MKEKKQATKIQASYQAMVDAVEEFVVKEGKTLQQAFHAAEEKLDDAKELSKDKIEQASKDVKDNLRVFGDAIEGVGEAYKDQIKFDLAYVNSSIWGKLQSIANSNTVELIEFTRSLREKAQSVTQAGHLAAHQEHNQWRSEHALWLDEVDIWGEDHEQAQHKLSDIEKALKQHTKSLQKHVSTIKAHSEVNHEHEKSIANAELDPSSENFKELDEKSISKHNKERKTHAKQSELHHSLKIQHFKIMAMINMLHKALNKNE